MEKAKSTGNFSSAIPHNPEFDKEDDEEDIEENIKNSQSGQVASENPEEPQRWDTCIEWITIFLLQEES